MEDISWGNVALEWGEHQLVASRIASMTALDGQPFSMVQDVGFRCLMQLVFQRHIISSCTTVSGHVVSFLFQECSDRVKAQLVRAQGCVVHVTWDICSSPGEQYCPYRTLVAIGGGQHSWQEQHWVEGYRWALLQPQVQATHQPIFWKPLIG